MKYDSTAYKVLNWFARNPGLNRAVTIGDLIIAINVHPGTAVHQRKTDLQGNGWQIVKTSDNRYWMPAFEARRALKYVKNIHAAHLRSTRKAA